MMCETEQRDFQALSAVAVDNSSDDDQMVVNIKSWKKNTAKFLQESDSEDSSKENRPPPIYNRASSKAGDSDDDVNDSASSGIDKSKLAGRTRIKRKLSSSDSSDSEVSQSAGSSLQEQKKRHPGEMMTADDLINAIGTERVANRLPCLVSSSDNEDNVPLNSQPIRQRVRKTPSVRRKRAELADSTQSQALDPDIFDANESSGEDNSTSAESEEEPDNRLDPKFAVPASRKATKPKRKSAPKQNEALQIYSEKQRMLREREVAIPYYEPPKKSLREFLSDHAPKLLKNLKHPPINSLENKIAKKPRPPRPPKHLEHMDYLEDNPLFTGEAHQSDNPLNQIAAESQPTKLTSVAALSTSKKMLLSDDDEDLPDFLAPLDKTEFATDETSIPTDQTQELSSLDAQGALQNLKSVEESQTVQESVIAENCEMVEKTAVKSEPMDDKNDDRPVFSDISVIRKTSEQKTKQKAKKEKLKRLLGNSVDLDFVPKLTCDADGIVNLDSSPAKLESFKRKFDQIIATREKQQEIKLKKPSLSVTKFMDDGSQVELSMDAFNSNSKDEVIPVNKLTLLKEILETKLMAQREDNYKKRLQDEKIYNMEEEAIEDLQDDEMSDSDDEQERTTPIEEENAEERDSPTNDIDDDDEPLKDGECDFEKDQAFMRRVKAVLDSDSEDDIVSKLATDSQFGDKLADNIKFNKFMSNTLDALSDSQSQLKILSNDEECTLLPLRVEESQSQKTFTDSEADTKSVKKDSILYLLDDDNARDPACLGKLCNNDSQALVFTQAMFNTQQAEQEVLELCSGTFTDAVSQPASQQVKADNLLSASCHQSESRQENTAAGAAVIEIAVKKQALHFSDEEESEDEQDEDKPLHSHEEIEEEEGDNSEESEDNLDYIDEVEELQAAGLFHEEDKILHTNALAGKKESQKKKVLAEFLEEEAELSGSDVGSDDENDVDGDEDVLDTEIADKDNVGTERELRQQIGKMDIKNMIDSDARELMLMKEMLLPDGDLHDDSKRVRKFRWRNVNYNDFENRVGDNSSDEEGGEPESQEEAEIIELHSRLDVERGEREKWIRQQREKRLQELEHERKKLLQRGEQDEDKQPETASLTTGHVKSRKKGWILNKSRKAIELFKERHKHITGEVKGPTSNKNMTFRSISREQAESQRNKLLN